MVFHLGLDFGTTGARACVVDDAGEISHTDRHDYPADAAQTPLVWREALLFLLARIPLAIAGGIGNVAIDGTSATVLLCDAALRPVSPALLYSDGRAAAEAAELESAAPQEHTVCSATSGLAKFLWLTRHCNLPEAAWFMHQADWLAALLTGRGGHSDYHNALKTGYDAERLCWPDWVRSLPHAHLLPAVSAPGAAIAEIRPEIAEHFGIGPRCMVRAGTTDSIAAFLAAGATEPGEGVTSLGTTLVLKLLSDRRVESAASGVYSHRYGNLWLAGGASNAGGGALRQFFTDEQLEALSARIPAGTDSGLDYYPLSAPGERFPVNDPSFPPRVTPRPDDDALFLHGLLQGLTRIEAAGYAKLAELGATPLKSVVTCGGGAKNPAWRDMRKRMLPMERRCWPGAAHWPEPRETLNKSSMSRVALLAKGVSHSLRHALHPDPQDRVRGHAGLIQRFPNDCMRRALGVTYSSCAARPAITDPQI
jgi:D-ribulokinase